MIKNFILRNKSVFYIGLVTFVIFVVIIFVSEFRRLTNKNYGPDLIEVKESTETHVTLLDKVAESTATVVEGSEPPYIVLPEESYAEKDLAMGTLLIEYTVDGFSPANAKALLNQKVKWVNKTNYDVYIRQTNDYYKEFSAPVLIPANGSLVFRMYRDGTWNYEDRDMREPGRIMVITP